MRQIVIGILAVFMMLAASPHAHAVQEIKVLLAKGPGVSSGQAQAMLNEMNDMMSNTGIANYDFVNAVGGGGWVEPTSCFGSDDQALVFCAVADLKDLRNSYNADIIILAVSTITPLKCGAVFDGMINFPYITRWAHPLGYAVVSTQCSIQGTFYRASHEALHLLYIEHADSGEDNKLSVPVRDNHAARSEHHTTAGGTPSDCFPNYTCTLAQNRMSAEGTVFPNTYPSGNSLHANAKNVVSSQSWVEVANYRPAPSLPTPIVIPLPCFCIGKEAHQDLTWTSSDWTAPGQTFVVEKQNVGGGWSEVFEGDQACIIFSIPPGGILQRVKIIIGGILESVYVEVSMDDCGCLFGGGGGGEF